MPPFAQPFMAFDFSGFFGDSAKRPRPRFTFLGKSIEEIEALISDRQNAGLFQALKAANPDLVTRGGGPNSRAKCLIVFQFNGFDTTYEEIAAACGISQDSAYQHMSVVRQWLSDAFELRVEHSGNRVYLADQQTLRERTTKLVANLELLDKQFETVKSCANSLKAQGIPLELPASAQVFLEAHSQAKALQASEQGGVA